MPDANMARRGMLQGYARQMRETGRLARLVDPHGSQQACKHRDIAEKVARELYTTVQHSGSCNPVVEEIRQELSREMGTDLHFTHPLGGALRILRQGPEGLEPLSEDASRVITYALWRITRRKINESMLKPSSMA